MTLQNCELHLLPEFPTASMSRGLWYVFRDGSNVIRAWGSTWLGLERVYFNHQLIDHFDHLKRREHYSFNIDNRQYRIQCVTQSHLKWHGECLLWRNGVNIDGWRCKRKKVLELRPILAHVFLGIALGLLGGLLHMPAIYGIFFVCVAIILTLITTAKTEDFIFERADLSTLTTQ